MINLTIHLIHLISKNILFYYWLRFKYVKPFLIEKLLDFLRVSILPTDKNTFPGHVLK